MAKGRSKAARRMMQVVGLLSLTRVYNIALIAAVQCMSVVFFFGVSVPDAKALADVRLWILVLCTWLCVGAGYIINYFYDKEKDRVNHPLKSYFNETIPQSFTLYLYITMNCMAVLLSSIVSMRSMLFFSGYIFVIWFYCHKVKKMPLVSNFYMSALGVIPLFAVLIYKKNCDVTQVLTHGVFIYLLLLCVTLVNDLKNQYGDAVGGGYTTPIHWGEKRAVGVTAAVFVLCAVSSLCTAMCERENAFSFYFMAMTAVLAAGGATLLHRREKSIYEWIYRLLKLFILAGVVCMLLKAYVL